MPTHVKRVRHPFDEPKPGKLIDDSGRRHDTAHLDAESRRAVYLAEGMGHGFCALTDDATVLYLCSTGYNPAAEHGVHPLDAELGLPWPTDVEHVLSEKDAAAPTLAEALAGGALPTLESCRAWTTQLAGPARTVAATP